MTAQRTLALRLELAKRPDLALAVLVHSLASRLLFGRPEALSCLTMSVRSQSMDAAIRSPEDGTV